MNLIRPTSAAECRRRFANEVIEFLMQITDVRSRSWLCVFLLAIGFDAAVAVAAQDTGSTDSEVAEAHFVRHVFPILREKCQACHGADPSNIEGQLDLRTRAGLIAGGDSGETGAEPGQPNESPIYLAAMRTHSDWSAMPPKEAEQLSQQQLSHLRDWIQQGVVWPSSNRMGEITTKYADAWSAEDGIVVATSSGLSADWNERKYQSDDLWAYRPVVQPEVAARANPIDALIAQRMPVGLTVSPLADRRTLLRRAAHDLTGLPPSEELTSQFLSDLRGDVEAFSTVVDSLLNSPHYGERMAQHWLDIVRYADSSGFANDYERGNAWRYRDYVVRAFNSDTPYNQFAIEQIAGDELKPGNPESMLATGFLRMGPWELTGMEVPKIARQRFLDDVVNSVGETFLAHSLQCARCHDHKFDPIPTRDYYAVQAVFAATQLAEPPVPFLADENTAGFAEKRYLEQARKEHLRVLSQLDAELLANAELWFARTGKAPTQWREAIRAEQADASEAAPTRGRREFISVFERARSSLMRRGVDESEFPPKLVGFSPQQFGAERVARKGLERLRWELDRYEPFALAVYNGRTPELKSVNAPTRIPAKRREEGELEETCVLIGGDPFARGEPVTPNWLSALDHTTANSLQADRIPDTIDGRRLAFARWIASPNNPLTSRTYVNRLWLWHFGQPIAGNPNNFGGTGKKPSHPELLDWLAWKLVESGWSSKALHRTIMLSETYRRSAQHPDPQLLAELDPEEKSFAVFKPRRLTAEELRDAMLVASGELNRTVGGIPNRPEINREAAMQPRQVMGTFAAAWVPNPSPEERHRRSLYALKLRGLTDPMFEVFNAPAPDFSCERRDASTVTPQVFNLLNSHHSHARALALAHRAAQTTSTLHESLQQCYAWTLLRPASLAEIALCEQHYQRALRLLPKDPPFTSVPTEIVREAVEENTGERFTLTEKLYAYQDFVPDLRPSDVPASTRALADICLALLNCNEFLYLY